jgi:hypothetical protein
MTIEENDRNKMILINQDNYFMCKRVAESIIAIRAFQTFLEERESYTEEDYSNKKA